MLTHLQICTHFSLICITAAQVFTLNNKKEKEKSKNRNLL